MLISPIQQYKLEWLQIQIRLQCTYTAFKFELRTADGSDPRHLNG